MSKKIKIIIFVLVFLVVILSVLFSLKYLMYNKTENNLQDSETTEQVAQEILKEEPPVYVDDNPITIGLYVSKSNRKELVSNYYCGWAPEEVLGVFYAVFTNEETLSSNKFNVVWKEYFDKYIDINKYRIGYNIKFTMDDGEVIDQLILNPDDAYLMYPEIQFYLYDDINLVPGKRYYHVTSEEMNENTICSSVKLVGDKRTPNITSPIELTAFTYNSEDDFEPDTGKYRGNSKYTVIINRK